MSVATLLFPEDPQTWKENMCEVGGQEAWLRANKIGKLAPWVKKDELETHLNILKAGGYTGPLNWYRQAMAGITHESELKINKDYAAAKFDIPTLFVGTAQDVIGVPAVQEAGMKDHFTNLTVKSIDTSHWLMIEKPEETWKILTEWIEGK
jgi:soluble epoxide hydrolase/lipid-phosphate phosphatase